MTKVTTVGYSPGAAAFRRCVVQKRPRRAEKTAMKRVKPARDGKQRTRNATVA